VIDQSKKFVLVISNVIWTPYPFNGLPVPSSWTVNTQKTIIKTKAYTLVISATPPGFEAYPQQDLPPFRALRVSRSCRTFGRSAKPGRTTSHAAAEDGRHFVVCSSRARHVFGTQCPARFRTSDELVLMKLILRNACPSNPSVTGRRRIASRTALFIQLANVQPDKRRVVTCAACLVLGEPLPVRPRRNEADLPV
jgi:hypothetical protein